MDGKETAARLAPYGLDCSRCADYVSGEIKELSARLVELLSGYKHRIDFRFRPGCLQRVHEAKPK